MNTLASARPLLDRSSLRRLLLLGRHQAYLLQHAHEIVKKILFHDLTLFVPARNGTEIYVETLVRGLDHRSAWHRHRTCHRSPEIRHSARPFALSNLHFIRMISQMIVGERLEKVDGLRLVIAAPSCWLGLTRPKDGGVLGMALFKRIPVLCVPRIVECPHEFQIVLCHLIPGLNTCYPSARRGLFYTSAGLLA